ncbi:cupin domain-containing protein [Candidatus Saccharibacteria bacterium]|nr:cupin domain-containing protein [Candidatus Saccharibacteria bacterium]
MFDWHLHDGLTEIMYVLAGSGKVHDEDGQYDYASGDLFTFPANEKHKIVNTGDSESHMIFVRFKEKAI